MDTKNEGAIPSEQSKAENAINKKGREADGRDINHQVQDKREHHMPRDNA